jgi:hypothetical protein
MGGSMLIWSEVRFMGTALREFALLGEKSYRTLDAQYLKMAKHEKH